MNNADPSGNEVEGLLAAIDMSGLFASIFAPVASKAASTAPVDFKFEVVSRATQLGLLYASRNGRPLGTALMVRRGRVLNRVLVTASSWVKVWSRDSAGGACNTVNQPDAAGTIILSMRSALPRSVSVYANVRMDLSGTGPRGAAQGKVEAQGKVLYQDVSNRGAEVHENNPYLFNANVGPSWTPVLKFVPTISFPKDNGKRSTGRAAGAIILNSYH